VDKGGAWPSWLLDPMSSTHNEFRLAACPLSGVPGRVRAPCQLILRGVGRCAALFSRDGRSRERRIMKINGRATDTRIVRL
jgi:hypothetical protein